MASATGYNNTLSIMDVMRAKNPDGSIAKVAEVLTRYNPILEDIPFIEGNTETGNVITRRSSLGTAEWRRINSGVGKSVGRTTQVTETCGLLEAYNEVDKRLLDMAIDKGSFMMQQANAQMEGMAMEMARVLMYGNSYAQPEQFLGFMPRLNELNTERFNGKPIVLDAGGTSSGSLASILLVAWGEDKVTGIYPKGTTAGLKYEDLGQHTANDVNGKQYEIMRQHWTWEAGLCVTDYRYVIRIANIDTSTLSYDEDKAKNLTNLMIDAFSYIPAGGGAQLVAYAPREVWAYVSKVGNANVNRNMNTTVNDTSRLISNIAGVPFRMTDAMLPTEAKVQ